MRGSWEYRTRSGTFRIIPTPDGRFGLYFEDEGLGGYSLPQQAAEDAAGGHCFWPSVGDPSRLGVPAALSEWTGVRA